jgi:glycosyltransferase involved in cell wall biosynthesis
VDGPDAGWRWTFTMHGPTEFEAVDRFDLPNKVRSARGVACISDFCRSQLMRMVEPDHWDKLAMIRMSVDTQRFVPPPAPRSHPDDESLRILYVGRLVPEKGGPVLVDAVAQLPARGVPVRVRMVGGGELMEPLCRQIEQGGLTGRIELIGPVGQDDLANHYHWADVFVLPSFQEGLPVVLMEAMATELPVVTTQIAAISELVVDGQMGRVLPPGRSDALAEALAELAADPQLRRDMGRRGRAAVQREFTSDRSAAGLIDFFTHVAR